jgi:hypothetical protein
VTDFSEFTSSHAEFLLYADDPGPGFDWLHRRGRVYVIGRPESQNGNLG